MKYMKIVAQGSGKVLDAAMSDATVILWEDNGGDNQLWYMDEAPELQDKLPHSQIPPLIRNKKFSELVSHCFRCPINTAYNCQGNASVKSCQMSSHSITGK